MLRDKIEECPTLKLFSCYLKYENKAKWLKTFVRHRPSEFRHSSLLPSHSSSSLLPSHSSSSLTPPPPSPILLSHPSSFPLTPSPPSLSPSQPSSSPLMISLLLFPSHPYSFPLMISPLLLSHPTPIPPLFSFIQGSQ